MKDRWREQTHVKLTYLQLFWRDTLVQWGLQFAFWWRQDSVRSVPWAAPSPVSATSHSCRTYSMSQHATTSLTHLTLTVWPHNWLINVTKQYNTIQHLSTSYNFCNCILTLMPIYHEMTVQCPARHITGQLIDGLPSRSLDWCKTYTLLNQSLDWY